MSIIIGKKMKKFSRIAITGAAALTKMPGTSIIHHV